MAVRTKEALEQGFRIIVNQGGTRSSKTHSLCQLFITLALREKALFTIVRGTMPSLRGSAMRDFMQLLEEYKLYNPLAHSKSRDVYYLSRSEIEFLGLDEPQKVRGRKRKYLWCNEANELTYEDFLQLALRTTGTIFLDYNPSETDHWIYDRILTRSDAVLIRSTYKDNPFLDVQTIQEIERLKDEDENYWRIYGLGERGLRRTAIFDRYDLVDEMPDAGETIWGLDFGFNHPTCLVRLRLNERDVHADEWLYRPGLTNAELIAQMELLGVPKTEEIYCDAAEPQRIEELYQAGFNSKPAEKGPDSVRKGIDTLKAHNIHITKRSTNVIRDWKGYSWKTDKNGHLSDTEPVKYNDHACDAIRYAIYTHQVRPQFSVLFEA